MEITRELVDGYVSAVAAALEAAGHKAEVPAQEDPDELKGEIVLPDVLADGYGAPGMALQYDYDGSWVAGRDAAGWVAAVYDPAEPGGRAMHTALYLGVVPEPGVVVRSVAAIVADGGFRAGRVVPGTAELLARYTGGKAPEPEPLDLLAAAYRDDGFEYCIICGSTTVAHRALYVGTLLRTTATRVAWCSADRCQEDRVKSAVQSVPVKAGPGGFYSVTSAW